MSYYPGFDNFSCPGCGEENLHQEAVEVMFRDAEDDDGTITTITPKSVVSKRALNKDLPGRRDTLRIYFTCEHCHQGVPTAIQGMYGFEIQQHKGLTLAGWCQVPNKAEVGRGFAEYIRRTLLKAGRDVPMFRLLEECDSNIYDALDWAHQEINGNRPEPPMVRFDEPEWLIPYSLDCVS